MPGNPRVMGGVLGVAVAEVILHRAQIRAPISEVVATGVPEHVRPNAAELRLFTARRARERPKASGGDNLRTLVKLPESQVTASPT
jgi:hypothetical protein